MTGEGEPTDNCQNLKTLATTTTQAQRVTNVKTTLNSSNIYLSDSDASLSNGLPQESYYIEEQKTTTTTTTTTDTPSVNYKSNQMNHSSCTDCEKSVEDIENDSVMEQYEKGRVISAKGKIKKYKREKVQSANSETESLSNGYFSTHMGDIQPVYTIAKDSTVEANHSAKNSILVPLTVAVIQSPSNAIEPLNGSILLQRSADLYHNHSKIVDLSTSAQENLQIEENKQFHLHQQHHHHRQLPQHLHHKSNDKEHVKNAKSECPNFVCPVCQESFKSKRSFNSHILVHCQLVKSPSASTKRSAPEVSHNSSSKRTAEEMEYGTTVDNKLDITDTSMPLDLSCKNLDSCNLDTTNPYIASESFNSRHSGVNKNNLSLSAESEPEFYSPEPSLSEQQRIPDHLNSFDMQNQSLFSDRSHAEDETDNLVNEALEHEKAFFDNSQNEHFLSEDSTGLDPPPHLPLVNSGGSTRKIKVCSDDGPPMVYKVKFYSEQIFISRILGLNEETGDKIELYKCYLCNFSFPSVSRLQAHLLVHKQRFVCRKCNISCDSRIQFSQHVQKEHVSKDLARESNRLQIDVSSDTSNAENTVTVAALLSALHGNSLDRKSVTSEDENERKANVQQEDEEEEKSEESLPASPSSETPMEIVSESMETSIHGNAGKTGTAEGDMFKMFSCRYCGKKFDRAFSCNRHERVHTGYKPCFCRICGRGFSEPRNLRHHVIRFHSDGSLRHLIKRDRRKRKDEEPHSEIPSNSDFSTKGILKECGNKELTNGMFSNYVVNRHENSGVCLNNNIVSYSSVHNGVVVNSFSPEQNGSNGSNTLNTYTSNLTKIFAASLDNSPRNRITEVSNAVPEFKSAICTTETKSQELNEALISEKNDTSELLEPGEIRLNKRAKVVGDGETGRRLILAEDSDDGSDHSPQFSSYAPRLNIVQEPVKRDTLVPITDDIGRTFYEYLRPYDCEYCEYSARTNSQLKVHKLRHEGIKQFTCDVCNYNGVTQSDLNRHKKTQSHIARSQNICSMCGLGFYSASQKQNLWGKLSVGEYETIYGENFQLVNMGQSIEKTFNL
ncbi:Sal-like protein 1 [Armadillidium nasatum]|uniref:Sal-like protein 1 n=1 Tax=Armadillidium nasatum TaxID=96803 RepID=A0A5N5STH9_9CRUS|nr:Sal-like protein 1 [Armadillidium nasatum]